MSIAWTFCDPEIARALRLADRAPALDTSFQSSVPGLYFTGPVATNSFGPLLRFACGSSLPRAAFQAKLGALHLANPSIDHGERQIAA